MKRRYWHVGFAVISGVLAAVAGLQFVDLDHARNLNHSIANPESISRAIEPSLPESASGATEPATQLAVANALSANGELEPASERYATLIREHTGQREGQAALFNLANAYLREAIRVGADSQRGRPLVELAKQRYRDLLREVPQSWDARFNLERALQFAPELGPAAAERVPPVKRVRVITPDFDTRDLP